jgi:hypothetical protein
MRATFHQPARALRSLCRGWQTPDPSPTPSARELPCCKPSEVRLLVCADFDEDAKGMGRLLPSPADASAKAPPDTVSPPVGAPWSIGTQGHPWACAHPCKYVTKRRGCKDGGACDHCHMCVWKAAMTRRPRCGVATRRISLPVHGDRLPHHGPAARTPALRHSSPRSSCPP